MELTAKKILVTGSSRGIGRATALALAREGAIVGVHYGTNLRAAEETLRMVQSAGAQACLLHADLRDPASATRLGNEAWEIMGGIDVLVNNAGVSYKKHFLDQTEQDMDYFHNVNFRSPMLLTQAVARKMIENERPGSIFSITSINAIKPGPGHSVYGSSKAALETLMKGVALELAPHGINVNTIAVGATETDMNADVWSDPARLEKVTSGIPMNRLGDPAEIAATVVALIRAGTYMTGATIVVDGGWLLKAGPAEIKRYTPLNTQPGKS
jgi:glucose 1-dehydrogenase